MDKMPKILHFADAHIDMANYGRHDPETGLPMRVLDFLKSLDTIVETAIQEKVDMVLFAGDAYKDRNPAPTFQREWDQRIMRLSRAGILTLLLVGNHDMSPSLGRAHAIEEFSSLDVPNVIVVDRPLFLTPDDLNGIPLQVIAIPWITRSGMLAHLDLKISDPTQVYAELEERLNDIIQDWMESADPEIPTMLTAHASVQGAVYGGERTVMLGGDLVLSGSLVKNTALDYVALGHIHKSQNLNEGAHPPVVYPGSIERVDFGEAKDDKFFVIAEVSKGQTQVDWRQLTEVRPFFDHYLKLESDQEILQQLREVLPSPEEMKDGILRLILEYPRDWEALIDDAALREMTDTAFEFQLVKRPQIETRIRIPEDKTVGSLTPIELLDIYWKSTHTDADETLILLQIANEIITDQHDAENNV
jgi:exonuclease SbcD